jgi:hypothetical protein
VTSIGTSCFHLCKNLSEIKSWPKTAPTLGSTVFEGTGRNKSEKILYTPQPSYGYDQGDWKTVLQDICGFEWSEGSL